MIVSVPSRLLVVASLLAATFSFSASADAQTTSQTRVAIVGLVHGHVQGFLHNLASHPEIALVGISDPDPALRQQ
jgi:purine nucleoside permease